MGMLEQILEEDNLREALEYLATRNQSGFGIDGMPLSALPEYYANNGELLKQSIRNGSYAPKTVILKDLLTKKGKLRTIALFSTVDRFLLRATHQKLERQLVPTFSQHSYAFRDGVGTLDAVKAAAQFVREGKCWTAEVDIHSYFDNIPHEQLIKQLCQRFDDAAFLNFLTKYLKIGLLKDGDFWNNSIGVIQGSPISPLLGNLYLDAFDQFCEESGLSFYRFGDDIRVFGESYEQSENLMQTVLDYLTNELNLPIAKEKCGIFPAIGRNMLGYLLVETSSGLEIQRNTRQNKVQHYQWHSSSLQQRENSYHIIGDGILTKKDYAMLFENQESKVHLPVECVHSINIHSDLTFSSNFFYFANRNSLVVNFFDRFGNYQGSFQPERSSTTLTVPLLQMQTYHDKEKRLVLAKQIILAGIHNYRANVRYYGKRYSEDRLKKVIDLLADCMKQINAAESVQGVMLIEAKARKLYFSVYNDMLPDDDFTFTKRSRRPPKDAINALISFGNMFLYNELATIINQSPLDIRISFLHSSGRRYRSLNLDIAEIFKPIIVDRVIFSLINLRMIFETAHFTYEENGAVFLNPEGKQMFLRWLRKKLHQILTVNGKKISYQSLMREEIQHLVSYFSDGTDYKPFRYY